MNKMRVSDYVAYFLEQRGIEHVFMVTGGGAMFLNDGMAKSKNIKGIFCHHEQACAMAAVGYTKSTNNIAVVMPTTGCGSTNTITGVLDAWQDSNKVVFISGNVNKKETTKQSIVPLRKFGVQEADIVSIVKSITKYAVMITNPNNIAYILEEAFYHCEEGRPGPVWIDIPLDVQGAYVDVDELVHFYVPTTKKPFSDYSYFQQALMEAKRPLVVAGNGIVLAGARDEFVAFVEKYDLPVVFTYLTIDLLPSSHRLAIGRLGTKGSRAGNFAVHNCDLLIVLGSSLSVSVTGFRYDLFAPNAKKIVVDIDSYEHKKGTVKIDKEYNVDVKDFFSWNMGLPYNPTGSWIEKCMDWCNKWTVYQDEYKDTSKGINMYLFMNALGTLLKGNNYVISDAGSAYFVTSQALRMNGTTRYITSGAQADMGFTLPCAVGVAIANPEANVIGITGDGSFQMNIQELQTIVNYKLNIKICILNNGGYLSIRNTMDKYFESRYYGTDEKSGLTLPDAERIAYGYNIKFKRLEGDGFEKELKKCLDLKGPVIIEVMCPFKQDIVPCSSAKEVEGKMVSQPLWNMYPFIENIEKEFI